MLTFEPLPQARVVRTAGQLVAPPRSPPAPRGPMAERLREALAVAIGLWPLTATMLFAFAMLVLTSLFSSP